MCLFINNKVRNNHHKEDGYCVAYKNVTQTNYSPYKGGYKYSVGENISNRPTTPLTCAEIIHNEIEKGFHLCLKYKDAKTTGKKYFTPDKTIKVYYKPEDVVSYGMWENGKEKTVVVTKLIIKSLEGV